MGAIVSYKRSYTYSPIGDNGNNRYSIFVGTNIDEYIVGIFNSRKTEYEEHNFNEYSSPTNFVIYRTGSTDLPICVVDNAGLCASLIASFTDPLGVNIPLEKVYFEPGVKGCFTLTNRQGSVLDAGFPSSLEASGTLCRVSVKDFPQKENNKPYCCTLKQIDLTKINNNQPLTNLYQAVVTESTRAATLSTNETIHKCPIGYSNGFSTDDCNSFMNTLCSQNPDCDECIFYMLAMVYRGESNIKLFENYCSYNLNSRVCSYFAIATRQNGQSASSDNALKNYCTRNPTDKLCQCYNTTIKLPENFTSNAYIGPIPCWYKPCAENPHQQFLLSEQIKQRSGCNITSCLIDVGSIVVDQNNSTNVTLLNKCSEVNNITVSRKKQKYGKTSLALLSLGIVSLVPLILLK